MSSWDSLRGPGQELVSLAGLLGFSCLALCCSAPLSLGRLKGGKCHSCPQAEQEVRSGTLQAGSPHLCPWECHGENNSGKWKLISSNQHGFMKGKAGLTNSIAFYNEVTILVD